MFLSYDPAIHAGADHAHKITLGSYEVVELPDVYCFFHNLLEIYYVYLL